MCFQKICIILTLFIVAANFSYAADPSPVPVTSPSIPMTSGMAAQTVVEAAKAKGELQNTQVQPQPSSATTVKPDVAHAAAGTEGEAERMYQRRLLTGLIIALLVVAVVYQFSRKQKGPTKAGA